MCILIVRASDGLLYPPMVFQYFDHFSKFHFPPSFLYYTHDAHFVKIVFHCQGTTILSSLFPLPHFTPIYYAVVWIFHRFPPLYTGFDGNTEMIFARLILTCTRSIHRSEKRESAIFPHQRMDFSPQRGRKSRVDTSQTRLFEKSALLYHISTKKQGRTIVQNARWWGGDNLSIKGLYLKNTLRLAFFRAEL